MFQDPSLKIMRDRFARARERYQGEMVKLTREDLDRKIRYLERYEVSLLDLLSTHATHFAGHW